jgi:hypothetical protein
MGRNTMENWTFVEGKHYNGSSKIYVVVTGMIRPRVRTSGGHLIIWRGTFWFHRRRKAFSTEIR